MEAQQVEAEKIVLTAAQELGKERILHSSAISVGRCLEAIGMGLPYVVFRFGPMLSGKTEGTIMDLHEFIERGINVHVFKLNGDDRYVTSAGLVGSQSGLSIEASPVEDITQISELIRTGVIRAGEVVGLVELPFMCKQRADLEEFIGLVQEHKIILVADGLGFWFNTQPLEMVECMLEQANQAFSFNLGTHLIRMHLPKRL
ncbi:hypothetical protein KJ918_07215 [Patescibacteria group bacterium]|nr:hypothetical protein [Patescibacteria group bacterium]